LSPRSVASGATELKAARASAVTDVTAGLGDVAVARGEKRSPVFIAGDNPAMPP
jgi:hypothetical protein